VVALAVTTDGTTTAIERARTLLERAIPGGAAVTQADVDAENERTTRAVQRISNLALAVTLVIAGCSLAVAVAGSIVERRQPFALLRLAGTHVSDLRRVVLAEAAAPLLIVAIGTSALGLVVTALTLATDTRNPAFALPGLDYWLALVGGLAVALAVVTATLPLLNRLTSPESVRIA
jgi:predicted lysophospholipase L1 biosynthesis ABC-type transport system permease subunit